MTMKAVLVAFLATPAHYLLATAKAEGDSVTHQNSLSFTQYLLGIVVAVALFLIREGITHARYGFRFRRRIAKDIKLVLENYFQHLPTLSVQHRKLTAVLEILRAGGAADPELSPIWSGDFSLLRHVYENSAHLNADVFQQIVRFYDITERLSEIRKTYNNVLQQCVISGKWEMNTLEFLDQCMESMKSNYQELLVSGCDGLILMAGKHWWLSCDVARCRDIKSGLPK